MELNKRGNIIKHNLEVLAGLNANHWEIKPGKYSIVDDELYPNNEKYYQVSYNPLAFGYSAVWDSEVLFNGRISTDVKVGLARHLANIFAAAMQWQRSQRGRKLGIEADLTGGGIVCSQDSKIRVEIHYEERYEPDTHILLGGRMEEFSIQYRGPELLDKNGHSNMPAEHRVRIDNEGNMFLGWCASTIPSRVCQDMSAIFRKVYK